MVKELVVYPDERIVMCGDVRGFDESVGRLIDDIKDTMEAHNLNALSAIQVAHPFNIAVIKLKDGSYLELVNPRIIKKEGLFENYETTSYYPGITFKVKRYEKIKLIYEDRYGNMKSIEIDDKDLSATIQRKLDYMGGATPLYKVDKEQREKIIETLKKDGVYVPEEVCPVFSKKDYIRSFTDKIIFFMGLSLLAPLFFEKETVAKFWTFEKWGYALTIILMIAYFIYAQYEAKKYRQCTSCQIGNQIGIIGKRLIVATLIFIASIFILK